MRLSFIIREITRRRVRAATNIAAVAVMIAFLIVLASVMNTYQKAIYLPFAATGSDMIIQKSDINPSQAPLDQVQLPFGTGIFSQAEADELVDIPHVIESAADLLLWQFDRDGFTSIEGIDAGSFVGRQLAESVVAGHFLFSGTNNQAVAEKHFAKFFGLSPGDTLKVGDKVFTVVGTVSTPDESQISAANIYINLSAAQQVLGVSGFSRLYVRTDNLSSDDLVRTAVARINPNALVISGSSISASLNAAVKVYGRFHLLAIGLMMLIAALIMFQINTAGLLERRKEIGVMQSVGWTKRAISGQVAGELFAESVMACVVGAAVGFFIILAIGSLSVQAALPGVLSNSQLALTAPLRFPVVETAICSLAIVGITGIVCLFLARRISAMKPMTNLKNF